MENLAENTYAENTYINSHFSWLCDSENEVSDKENEEILRTLENLSEDDLKTARSEIVFV